MRMKAAPAQCYRNLRVDLTDHPIALDRKHRLDKIDERRATPWPSYPRRQLNGCGERANGPPAPRSGASTADQLAIVEVNARLQSYLDYYNGHRFRSGIDMLPTSALIPIREVA